MTPIYSTTINDYCNLVIYKKRQVSKVIYQVYKTNQTDRFLSKLF